MDSGQETEPLGLRLNVNALPETDLVPAFAYLDVQPGKSYLQAEMIRILFVFCFWWGYP